MTTTEPLTEAAETTGVVTHSATLWAPVRLVGTAPHGNLIVETLPGGVGGWNRAGKTLTVSPRIFEQD